MAGGRTVSAQVLFLDLGAGSMCVRPVQIL